MAGLGSGTTYLPNNVGLIIDDNTTNLTNGSTYTTTDWIDVTIFASVALRVYASHNGNFSVLFSADGSTTHSTVGPYLYETNLIFTPIFLDVGARYVKVTFTNDSGSDQTDFHIQLIASPSTKILKIGRNRILPLQADSIPVRSADELDVMRGNVEGEYIISKYGRNADVDAAEDIWDGGGDYTGFPTATAENFEVLSSSANDTNTAGTGARQIRLFYLNDDYEMFDANGDFLTVDVNLNGTTGVDSGTSGMRVWRAKVISSGSSRGNEGVITIRWITTTSVVFTQIQIGSANTEITPFTIPAGFRGYLKRYSSSMRDNTSNEANMAIIATDFGSNTDREIRPFVVSTAQDISRNLYGGEEFEEKTDIKFRCTSITNANGDITVSYAIHLVMN